MDKNPAEVGMTEIESTNDKPTNDIGPQDTSIDFTAIPGTSHLIDTEHEVDNHLDVKHDVILIPTPSDDPNDPLNWTATRKLIQVFCIVGYCFGGSIPGCVVYSIITDISTSPGVDITVSDLNDGTGYNFLFLGLGGLIMLPLSQHFGKRPIYLISMLGVIATNLFSAYSTNDGMWIASNILKGVFYSPIESLPEITIADLYFEHERATYMGIYGCALFSSNYAAPMLAGFVTDALGWRWAYFIAVIFAAVCTVGMFLFMEETNYERKIIVRKDSTTGELAAITSGTRDEKLDVALSQTVHNGQQVIAASNNLANQASIIVSSDDKPITYPPEKTFWQKLSLTSGIEKENHLLEYFKMPFVMFQFPVVLYSGFLYGISLFFYSILNTTESLVLASEPYNFSTSMCGLAYVSPFLAVFLIYPYAGWSTDWIKIKIAAKHNGTSQAEDRLWVLIVYAILGPASLILWGVGAAHSIHWIGLVIGMGLMGGLCVIGCVSSVTYCLDTYGQLNVPAICVLVIIRNTMNFALDYAITPWLDACGYQTTFITCAMICLVCIGSFIIMEWTGLYWRKKTAKAYWKLVKHAREVGYI